MTNNTNYSQEVSPSLLHLPREWIFHPWRQLIAVSFALFSLTGRWSFSRLWVSGLPENLGFHTLFEPRLWAIVILFLCAVIFGPFKKIRSTLQTQENRIELSNHSRRIFFLLIILFSYLLFSFTFIIASGCPLTKVYETVQIMLYCICTYYIISRPDRDMLIGWIWFYLVVFACMLVVMSLPTLLRGDMTEESGRMSVLGGGPNVFIRFAAIALIHFIHRFIHNRGYWRVFCITLLVAPIIVSGCRGGMFAIALSIFVLFYLERLLKLQQILKTVLVLSLLVLSGYLTLNFLFPTTLERIQDSWERRILVKTIEQGSSSGRDDIWQRAYTMSWESPFLGHGLGSWNYFGHGTYPHNIFLEFFYETGLIGVGLFIAVLWLTYRVIKVNNRANSINVRYTCLFCMFLTASMFSGDFFDSRCVFSLLLIVSVPVRIYQSFDK